MTLKKLNDLRLRFEADERKSVPGQKFGDLRYCEAVLHDVEQQVAASAHAVKVDAARYPSPAPIVIATEYFLAAFANIVDGGTIPALRNERPRFHNAAPGGLAVKAYAHFAAWS